MARHADGRLIVGGQFTVFNGVARRRLTQLNYDGSTDTTFDPGTAADGSVNAVAAAPEGKVIVGGDFLVFNGAARGRLARLNANGSLDTSFAPAVNGTVQAVAVQPDGKVLLAGGFSAVNGTPRNRVARLNADGSLDSTFDPGAGPNSTVLALTLQADGRMLVGGYFWQFNGVTRNRVARLNTNGSVDTDFVPGTHDNGYVNGISVGADGKVFVCGGLYVGLNSRILRLHPNGALDTSFNPGNNLINSDVTTAVAQDDGKVVIGGYFTAVNGVSRRHVARLNINGTLDTAFNPGVGASDYVWTMIMEPDGALVAGGAFTTYQGVSRNRLTRIQNSPPLNPPPQMDLIASLTVAEDSGPVTVNLTGIAPGGTGEDGRAVTNLTATSYSTGIVPHPTVTYTAGSATATLTLGPVADANGTVTIAVVAQDNGPTAATVTRTFVITVTPVNDAPGFALVGSPNITIAEDSGPYSAASFASSISVGPANESAQTVSFLTSNTASNLFSAQPVIAANGTLTFTPAANAFGNATVTVVAVDSGGAPGVSNSAPQTFTIEITNLNDPPAVAFATNNVVVLEDAAAVSSNDLLSLSPGPFNEPGEVSLLSVANNNNGLFTVQPFFTGGTLNFTPAPNANGVATVTVIAQDDTQPAGLFGTNTITLTVTPVNDAPTLTLGVTSLSVLTNIGTVTTNLAAVTTVGPANETGQSITNYSVSNDNNALFSVQPALALNGTLTFTVAGHLTGSATVSVRAQDNGGTLNGGVNLSPVVNVTINVGGPNQVPTFTLATNNVVVAEDSVAASRPDFLTALSAGEVTQTVTNLTTSNNNTSLFSAQPAIAPDGTLTFTPAANANGLATVTVRATDNGLAPAVGTQTFTITVTAVNDAPSFALGVPASSWQPEPALAAARWGAVAGTIGTKAYLAGGLDAFSGGSAQGSLLVYDTVSRAWSTGAGMPTPRYEAAGGVINGKLYVVGGWAPGLGSQVYEYDPGTDAWTTRASLGHLTAGGSAGVIAGKLYLTSPVFGGFGLSTAFDVFDPVANTWTSLAPATKRYHSAGAGAGGKFYLFGGHNEASSVQATADVFDPGTGLWSAIAPMPTGRAWASAVELGGKIYVVGGADTAGTALSTVEIYDPVANSWQTLESSPSARFGGGATVVGDTIHYAGGVAGGTAVATHQSLRASSFVVSEDSGTQTFSGLATNILTGPANESAQTVSFLTSNTAPNLFSSQPVIAANGTLTFTPAPNAWGTITVSVRAQDNGGTTNGGVDTSAAQTFTITITNINDAPAISFATNNLVVSEDAGTVSRNDFLSLSPGPFNEPGTVAITSLVNNNNSLFSVQPAFTGGTLTFTPAANTYGVATVTVIAQDDTQPAGLFSTNSFTITVLSVNDAPTLTLTNLLINLLTNAGGYSANLGATVSVGPPNESGQGPVSFLITNSNNAFFTTQPYANQGGFVSFSVAPGVQGTATLYVRVQDTGGTANGGVNVSEPVLVTVNITPANAAPSFTLGATSITQLEDSGTTTSNAFLTALSPGPQPLDASQTVTLTVVNNNNSLFSAQPALTGSGAARDLTFTPAANASGVATVTITATDNGTPPLSTVRTVTINVLSVNDAPGITFASNNIALENAGAQSLSGFATITTGPAAESSQTITNLSVSNDNNALFSVQPTLTGGTLTFTPILNASGIATVTVIAQDNGGTANGGVDRATNTFTIAIAVVNQAPSFNLRLANTQASPIVNGSFETGDFTGWTASDTANTTPSLAVRANGANLGIFNVLSTDGTRSATHGFGGTSEGLISIGQDVTVPANATAQATFTYRIAWNTFGSTATSNRVFRVSVQPAGGGTELGGQTLLTAEPNTFGVQTVNQSGSLDLTPYAGQTVRLAFVAIIPAGDTANGGFQLDNVSVTVNTPDFSVYENSGSSSTANYATNILAGPANESAQTVAFQVSNNNNALFSSQPAIAANGTLTFTPAADAHGAATVTVVAQDNGGTANGGVDTSTVKTFTITVLPVNSAPRVTVTLATVTVNEDSAAYSGSVATITTGPADESSQSITNVVTSNDNNSLFSVQPSVSASGVLTFTLAAHKNGSATVTFTAQDDGGTANGGVNQTTRTITITVMPVNDAPSFALPAGTTGPVTVSTFAGLAANIGGADGTGSAAQFNYPQKVASDSAGNVLVADSGNNTIRRITPSGVVTTLAGTAGMSGNTDGTGANARFWFPNGVAADGAGNVYVADGNNNAIRKITPGGVVTTLANLADSPSGLAIDSAGNLYAGSYTKVRKITPAGVVTTFAGSSYGYLDATGTAAQFAGAVDVAVDSADNVYVADSENGRVRKITPGGVVSTLATGLSLYSVAVDSAGNVFVGTGNNHIKKITPAGVTTIVAGAPNVYGTTDGLGSVARFGNLYSGGMKGLAFDPAGNLFVVDQFNFTIRKVTFGFEMTVLEDSGAQNIATFATSVSPGPADESAQTVSFTVSNDNNPLFSSQPALAADGTLTFTPASNAFGSATVTVTAVDSGSGTPPNVNTSAAQTFTITVTNVNDRPSVTLAGNVTRNEDSGAHSQSSFATFSAGNAGESGQAVLAYTVNNNNSSLFSVQPAISTSGTLTFTPAANSNGVATVTVSVRDNGGTANSGVDTSDSVTFTITINSVNDAPSFALNGGVLNTGSGGGGGSGDGLIVGGATYYPAGGATVLVAPDLTYSNSVSSTTAGAAVSIDNGQSGDVLGFNTTLATSYGISGTYNSTTKVLSFTGTATTARYQEVLRSVTYVNAAGTPTSDRTISFNVGLNTLYNPLNGHFYEYVSTVLPWASAFSAATNRTFQGMRGYLATITSPEENDFIRTKLLADAWIGGSDDFNYINAAAGSTVYANQGAAEGKWYWVTGPEKGLQFSQNNHSPVSFNGRYQNWAGGEPNDSGSEHYAQFYYNNNGRWNDLRSSHTLAYMVEYGGQAGDVTSTLALSGFRTLTYNPVLQVAENSGLNTYSLALTNISAGPAEEPMTQLVDFIVSNNNGTLFTILPAFAADGTLTFTLAANAFGSATVTVQAHDDAGTANGGVNTSAAKTFTIVVNNVNEAPTVALSAATVTALEDAATTVSGFATVTSFGVGESGQTLVGHVLTAANTALFSVQPAINNSGVLTFTPAANANGSTTVTVVSQDSGGTAGGGVDKTTNTFTITITAVNDAPSFVMSAGLGASAGPWAVSTFAGTVGTPGSADGTGTAARFNNLVSVALDRAGNLYVSEYSNHTIRKITPAGVVTTFAGLAGNPGSTDGTGTAARFTNPVGLVLDSAGNLYVSEIGNHTIRKVSPAGVVTTFAGVAGSTGSADGTGSAARFNLPQELAIDSSDNLYLADGGNHLIRKITLGGVVSTLAGSTTPGSADGTGAAARFNGPNGVAVDSAGNVYVADSINQTIRKITPAGVVTTLAGTATPYNGSNGSSADGTGAAAGFNYPTGVAVDAAGNVFVADQNNRKIRMVTPAGVVTTLAGSGTAGSVDGVGASAQFNQPQRIAFDAFGSLYVTDTSNQTIRKMTPAVTPGVTVLEDSGAYTGGASFVTSISAGPADESGQTVSFTVANNNNALFSSQPAIAANGTLAFTPAANVFGSATVTVTAVDSGPGTPPDVNTSAAQTFTITVANVNEAPTVALSTNNVVTLEDTATTVSGFASVTSFGPNESAQTLVGHVLTAANTALFSVQPAINTSGVLTFTPAANANGSTTVTVVSQDSGGTANGGVDQTTNTFTITITPVNDAPSFALPAGTTASQQLFAWGWNGVGQVGDGTTTDRHAPVQIGTDNWQSIAGGPAHSVAVRADGTLWAWGYNNVGQLGDGTTTDRHAPVQVGTASDWQSVAAGVAHTVALKRDGTVWTWGNNFYGQLGDGTTTDRHAPVQVGTATSWAAVAAGSYHTLALRQDGTLWAWGVNNLGQVGDGTTINRLAPVQVGTATDWQSVAAGVFHTVALKANGSVWTWGDNSVGQLGDGTTTSRLSPAQVGAETHWRSVAAGQSHVHAVTSGGTLWAWGYNAHGQLGDGTTTSPRTSPVQIGGDTDWRATAAGSFHNVAVKTTGTLWAWGLNDRGQLGDGTTTLRTSPVQIGTASNWLPLLGVGERHTLALAATETAGPLALAVAEGSSAYSTNTFATSISAGPANESAQVVDFLVSNDNNALFSSQPAIAANGTLTFTPAANAFGTATVTVRAHDDGGTANSGVDTSAAQTFTITVTPVNDPPTVALAQTTVTALEDSGASSASGFASVTSFGVGESGQTLVGHVVTAADTALFSVQPAINTSGVLTFTPAAHAHGSTTVAVVSQDSGGTANGGVDKTTNTFTITVTPVNDAPSFALPAGVTTVAGETWTARDSTRSWRGVASSADGSKLVAAHSGGQLYTSTDSGVTWTARESSRDWEAVASSADGSKLVAVNFAGQIYTSTDSGTNWTARESSRQWRGVASSADGSKLVAVVYGGEIFTSADSGVNWTLRESTRNWWGVASSDDGSKLIATVLGGQIFTSTDSGVSWTARESSRNWTRPASSADGSKLVAPAFDGQLYTSTDSGVTWTARESSRGWTSVASSADGSKLVAAVDNGGQLYTSTDSGMSWTVRESIRSWQGVASSADGSKLVAVVNPGQIYTSVEVIAPHNITVAEGSGAYAGGANFATSISAGPANESAQVVSFVVTNNNNALFSVQPAIAANGTLTFTPAGSGSGTATVTVYAQDDGGTDNGGVNTAGPQTFTITLTPVPTRVYLSGATPAGPQGDTVVVPILLDGLGTESAVGFTLNFDASKLSFTGIANGADALSGSTSHLRNVTQSAIGRVGILITKDTGVTFAAGTRELVLVTFTVNPDAALGATPVTFTDVVTRREVADSVANSVPAAFVDGSVTITAATVGTPSDVEGDVSPRPFGNGTVTVTDSVQISRFAAGLDIATTANGEFQRADCAPLASKGDGRITVADWLQAQRFAAALDTPGAVGGPTVQSTGLLAASAKLSAGTRVVRVAGGNLVAGRANTVSVQLDSQGNEAGISLSLAFDPTALTFVSATTTSGGSLIVNSMKASAGKLGLVLVMPAGTTIAAGTKDIVTLTFNATGSGATAISVTGDSPVAREVADVNANVLGASFVGGSFNLILPAGLKAAGMERTADGSLRLVVRNSDGSAVTAAQAAKYVVHVTSNLGGAWTVLPNALVVENGALKIVDPAANGAGLRLYKLVETP